MATLSSNSRVFLTSSLKSYSILVLCLYRFVVVIVNRNVIIYSKNLLTAEPYYHIPTMHRWSHITISLLNIIKLETINNFTLNLPKDIWLITSGLSYTMRVWTNSKIFLVKYNDKIILIKNLLKRGFNNLPN